MSAPILAREAELSEVHRFLGEIERSPAALVLEGEPGIGKTTVWLSAIEAAESRGLRVLPTAPTEAEAALSFAALADLLGGAFSEVRAELPRPQERALAATLLLADEDATVDPRTVATGLVGVLERLAAAAPIVLAVDDLQWLDAASRRALEFAVRRTDGPIGILLARRGGPVDELPLALERALPAGRVRRLTLEPLSLASLHHLVRERLGFPLSRPLVSRIAAASGGNPYVALEIARLLSVDESSRRPDAPLPLPRTQKELVAARTGRLSDSALEAALVVAALSRPTRATVLAALGGSLDARAGLDEAEAAGLLLSDGERIRFTHPLLASGVYSAATGPDRRAAHRRLSEVIVEPEERARHLARSGGDPAAARAASIEEGARSAMRRGAPDAAAELFEAALRATPADDSERLGRRYLGCAAALNAVGEVAGARRAAEQALERAGDAAHRSDALVLLATLAWFDGDAASATERVERALAECDGEDRRRGSIFATFARFNFGYDVERALRYTDAAIELLDERDDPAVLAHALIDRCVAAALRGEVVPAGLLARGLELEARAYPALPHGPQPMPLIWFHCTDAVADARARYAWEEAWYRDRGEELWLADRRSHLAVAELRGGDAEAAEQHVEAASAAVQHLDVKGPRALILEKRALVDAHRGRSERAREILEPLVATLEETGQRWWAALALSTRAFADRSAGDDAAADRALERMDEHARAIGVLDVLFDRSEPYRVDALVAAGELEEARRVLARLERRGAVLARPWIDATLPAARALVSAAEGNLEAAVTVLDRAECPDDAPTFERAWASLAEGRVRRRAKQRRAAGEALDRAAESFEGLGAVDWAARARADRGRAGLRRSAPDELTPSERQVAELAASGRTNREVAEAAFMSVKTVEANLSRIYRKLGIRSRAELGARMALERDPAPKT